MPNTILLKKNSTAGTAPTAGQLAAGELAINTADGRLFAKNAAGTVVNLPVSSISGQTITPSNIGLNASSPTSPLHIRRTEASSQDSAAKILSSTTTASNDANWRGRMLVGAQNKTFLMGCYANMAAIGAHNWTSADAQTGAAWTDLYINPDGAASIYLGATKFASYTNSWSANSGIVKIDNNTGRVNVTTGFGIDSNNIGADFKIVSGADYDDNNDSYNPANGTLQGAAQAEIFQVIAGDSYYNVDGDFFATNEYVNLGRFHCNGIASRGSFSLSNSGTPDPVTGDTAWQNNVLQFFVHGSAYVPGYYGGNTSDAGCAMIVTQGADIQKLQIGNYGAAPIEFFTGNVKRFRIRSADGNFDIYGNTGADYTPGPAFVWNNTADPDEDGTPIGEMAAIQMITGSSADQGTLAFYTGAANAIAERVRIDQNGNVGIGTGVNVINAKLEVVGDVAVSGGINSPGDSLKPGITSPQTALFLWQNFR